MTIFESVGSNYDWRMVVRTLFSKGNVDDAKNLKKVLKQKYEGEVVLVHKARQAIELAFKLANLPKGSEVAICGFTCFAVYEAIKKVGLEVVYLDIDSKKRDLNFSALTLERALDKNPRIKAVMIQNTLGTPVEMEKISSVCRKKKLVLIEDLAHSLGAVYENGEEAGCVGDFTVLSFSQDKVIDVVAGGALIIRNKDYQAKNDFELAEVDKKYQIRDRFYPLFTFLIRNTYSFGLGKVLHETLKRMDWLSKPMEDEGRHLSVLPVWQAKLVKKQLSSLRESLSHRREIARVYAKILKKEILSEEVVGKINQSTNLRFPIFVNNRASLIKYLKQRGVYVADIWYDAPVAPKKYLSRTDYKDECPESEKAASVILNLPTHQNVNDNQAQQLAKYINQWLESN